MSSKRVDSTSKVPAFPSQPSAFNPAKTSGGKTPPRQPGGNDGGVNVHSAYGGKPSGGGGGGSLAPNSNTREYFKSSSKDFRPGKSKVNLNSKNYFTSPQYPFQISNSFSASAVKTGGGRFSKPKNNKPFKDSNRYKKNAFYKKNKNSSFGGSGGGAYKPSSQRQPQSAANTSSGGGKINLTPADEKQYFPETPLQTYFPQTSPSPPSYNNNINNINNNINSYSPPSSTPSGPVYVAQPPSYRPTGGGGLGGQTLRPNLPQTNRPPHHLNQV